MEMTSVRSSFIAAVGYDPKFEILRILMKDGREYTKHPVAEEIYTGFMETDRKGEYFNEHIRDL